MLAVRGRDVLGNSQASKADGPAPRIRQTQSRSAPPCLLQVWAEFQLLLQQQGGDPALASLVELVASCPAGGWGSSPPPPGLVQQLAGAP